MCNDMGVFATCGICFTGCFGVSKLAFAPFDSTNPTAITVVMLVCCALGLLFLLKEFTGLCHRHGAGAYVPIMTNAALYGGLMGDTPVCPSGVDDGEAWQRAASTEELARCVYGNVLERTKTKDKRTCVPPMLAYRGFRHG